MAERKVNNDSREAELVEKMVLDSMEYIHVTGTKNIVEELNSSTDTTATMAAIAYKCVRGVAENNKATAQVDMDMDMMMGVTTECIDMVTEVAEATGQIQSGMNVEQMKEDTLLKVSVLHGEQLGDENGEFPEEMKVAAATDMRDYIDSPGAQEAFDYANTRAKAEGLNPEDMKRAGNEMAFGSKNPLAEGIDRGLMAKTIPYKGPDSAAYEAAEQSENPNLTMPDGSPIPTTEEIQAQMDAEGIGGGGMLGQPPQDRFGRPIPGFDQPVTQDSDPGLAITPEQIGARAERQAPLMPAAPPPKPAGGY